MSSPGVDSRPGPRLARLALAACLAAGCGDSKSGPKPKAEAQDAPKAAKVARIERRDIAMKVSQPGTVQAFESTPIYSRIAGYVDKYQANIGDRVKAGQVLLTMWVPDLDEALGQKKAMVGRARVQIRVAASSEQAARATLENTKARVVSSEAGVKRAQADYSRWESEYNRLVKLVANQVLSSQVRDETYRQFEVATAARDQAYATVNESKASKDKAEADLQRAAVDVEATRADLEVALADERQAQVAVDYGRIRANYDGVISQRNVSPGDYLQAGGGTGGRPLFMLEQTDPVRVFVGIPELAAGFIKDQDTALVHIQAVPGDSRRGRIVRSGFSLNPTSRTLQAEIDIDNPDGRLRPGMYVTVTVAIERHQVFAAPSASIVSLGGDRHAIDLRQGDKVVRTPVLVGPADDRYTEILRKQAPGGKADDWAEPTGDEQLVLSSTGGVDPTRPAK